MKVETLPESPPRPSRLVITDDHEIARSGLRSMLESEKDLIVVGEAKNGREAITLCRSLRPDLVLTDVEMPEMDGLAAIRTIKQKFPEIGVIIVTIHDDPYYLFDALKAGAGGYLLKDASKHEVTAAVRQVLNGESPLNPGLAALLLRQLVAEVQELARSSPEVHPRKLPESLTPREVEVLQLLVEGHTNREIAQKLVISASTAKMHVQHIIAKLEVSDRTQAAVRAIQLGISPQDPDK